MCEVIVNQAALAPWGCDHLRVCGRGLLLSAACLHNSSLSCCFDVKKALNPLLKKDSLSVSSDFWSSLRLFSSSKYFLSVPTHTVRTLLSLHTKTFIMLLNDRRASEHPHRTARIQWNSTPTVCALASALHGGSQLRGTRQKKGSRVKGRDRVWSSSRDPPTAVWVFWQNGRIRVIPSSEGVNGNAPQVKERTWKT